MSNHKIKNDVINQIKKEGLSVRIIEAGDSPYSPFDLIAYDGDSFEEKRVWKLSKIEIKSVDPETAYRGRHAVGRLFTAMLAEDGIEEVNSTDDASVELVNGEVYGKKVSFTLGDLF